MPQQHQGGWYIVGVWSLKNVKNSEAVKYPSDDPKSYVKPPTTPHRHRENVKSSNEGEVLRLRHTYCSTPATHG